MEVVIQMNNDVQIVDVIDSFKEQIANMAYQIAFKDATIKALEKQVEELEREAIAAGRRVKADAVEPVEAIEEQLVIK